MSAIEKLQPSQLATPAQMELMGGDVDIANFKANMEGVGGMELVNAISDAQVTRTIEGASTVVVTVEEDRFRTIQRSDRLGRKVDVNIDGLWWRLVSLNKTGYQIALTWEEREVNLLRYYNSLIWADRSKVTRAQFVLRMIKEVKEEPLKFVIPELNIVQPVSDVAANQILVDGSGKPVASTPASSPQNRDPGFAPGSTLTAKGHPATAEQINNAEIILNQAHAMHAPYKVQVAAITTAITESVLINLYGGDLDSVGVFQQRRSQGWPATRDVATDAAAFIQRALKVNEADPSLSIQMLCQTVQHSAFADGSNYAPWVGEAMSYVGEFGGAPSNAMFAANAQNDPSSASSGANFFMRGQVSKRGSASQFVLTKESSWDCMQRLASEVNWRCFCVSGVIYFISEDWLFRSKPFLTISEDSDGIDWIDYDFDEGKKKATVTITAHLSRWSAPPGSIVNIQDQGRIVDGNWIVHDVTRSLYNTVGTITLEKPLPILREPTSLSGIPTGFNPVAPTAPPPPGADIGAVAGSLAQKQIVLYAQSQIGLPYQYGAEDPGVAFDCSGLTQASYDSAGLKIPRVAQAQYDSGAKVSVLQMLPGDLVFFSPTNSDQDIGHVGIYIGGGRMIDAPQTGEFVRAESFTPSLGASWGSDSFVGVARYWR